MTRAQERLEHARLFPGRGDDFDWVLRVATVAVQAQENGSLILCANNSSEEEGRSYLRALMDAIEDRAPAEKEERA